MPISDKKKITDDAWRKKALESIAIRVRKGTRSRWKEAAESRGLSLAQLIQQAVEKFIAE